ncbi:hypothetical protein SAMN02910369_02222 [Lachnospiraceae bacterium NE2001]|nr:hypothetical protein SAMN02910369_02222 [Lachnospiraceae bacterium NE2001]
MAKNRKQEVKIKKMLLLVWTVFIMALISLGVIAYNKRDTVKEDLDMSFSTRFSYQTNANPDINALIITYLSAMSSSDQATLQSCVVDPTQYDNMSTVQSQSKVITAYKNINCYTVEGMDENSTVVYAIANISIVNVESTPLDMLGPYYVVKKDGHYLIDNTMLSQEVSDYIGKLNRTSDIQDLYKMVKDDEDKKAEQDPAFKEFLNRLNN